MNEGVEINKKRAEFFFEHKTSIHIDTINKRWYNGLILEIHSDFILVLDRVVGEVPVYFEEIVILDKNKEQEGKDEMEKKEYGR